MIEDKLHSLATSYEFPWYAEAEELGLPDILADVADVIHWARKWSSAYETMMGEEGTAYAVYSKLAGDARIELIRALKRLDKHGNG